MLAKELIGDINFSNFPITRYQGSKRKILPWIYQNIKHYEFDSVLDAFGGSASVSYMFKRMGKNVTYNDNLKFNHLIGKALIENNSVTLSDEDIQKLLKTNLAEWNRKIIETCFDGVYYLPEENAWLDNIITNLIHNPSNNEYKDAIAMHAIFQACLIKRPFNLFHRKNLYLRINEVERNFGNKTSWDKPFEHYFKKFAKETNNVIFDNNRRCLSINKSALEIDPYGFDFVYLDPPYFTADRKIESSNYLRCYHFLEGMSNYKNWESMINFDTVTKSIKPAEDYLSLTNSNIEEMMTELIFKFRKSIIAISYKSSGIPSIETLTGLLRKYKKNVEVYTIEYTYALSKNSDNNTEVLLIGH